MKLNQVTLQDLTIFTSLSIFKMDYWLQQQPTNLASSYAPILFDKAIQDYLMTQLRLDAKNTVVYLAYLSGCSYYKK